MSAKHTPGPWSFEAPKEGTPDITVSARIQTKGPHSKPGQTIPMYITRVYGTGEYTGPINGERLANARLIAAAPDLLEVLKQVLKGCEVNIDTPEFHPLWGAAHLKIASYIKGTGIIAKAEGRE